MEQKYKACPYSSFKVVSKPLKIACCILQNGGGIIRVIHAENADMNIVVKGMFPILVNIPPAIM